MNPATIKLVLAPGRDLFCVFYAKEVEPALTSLLIQLYSVYDRGGNELLFQIWNIESQQALWASLLCGLN